MKKKALSLLMAAVMTLSLTACSTSNQKPVESTTEKVEEKAEEAKEEVEDKAEEAAADVSDAEYSLKPTTINDRTLKVALIPVTINTSYTMTINGAKERIKSQGYDIELTVQAPAGNTSSIEEQGNIIENMIQQGVDAIALATESDNSMLPYLREAEKAGIPLFFFNMTELDPEDHYYVTSIGYDQKEAGKLIGKWIADNYGDKEMKLAVLEGYPGVVNTMRMDGFNEALEGTKITTVASQCANWTRADGQTVTESILTANPDVNILYADYDEMTLGGMVAVRDRDLQDQVIPVGFGATEDAINAIKEGRMAATVDVMEYYTGYDIIDAIHQFCAEGKEVEKVINRESKVYDQTNVNDHDDSVFATE